MPEKQYIVTIAEFEILQALFHLAELVADQQCDPFDPKREGWETYRLNAFKSYQKTASALGKKGAS